MRCQVSAARGAEAGHTTGQQGHPGSTHQGLRHRCCE